VGGGLLAGLQIALSGLQAQQAVMSVSANNIANSSDPNYALQQVELAPNPPYSPPALDQPSVPGQFGQGVAVAGIARQVSHFLQTQQWGNAALLGAATQQTNSLGQAQALFDEPSSQGLNQALSAFWQAWDALAGNPQSVAARSQVLNQGQALAATFNSISQGLTGLQQNLDASVVATVGQINTLAAQIASYNRQIGAAVAAGQHPNDLEDARDALVGQLAQFMPLQADWSATGEVTLGVGGVDLVAGSQVMQLQTAVDPATGMHDVRWAFQGSGQTAAVSGGQLGAMLALRDQTIPGYLNELNTLAGAIAQSVNAQQAVGSDASGNPVASYDGGAYAAFFVGAAAAPAPAAVSGSSALGPGSYRLAYALTDAAGTPSVVSPIASTYVPQAGDALRFQVVVPPGASGVDVYVAGASGQPQQLGQVSPSGTVSYSAGASSGLSATASSAPGGGTVLTITLSGLAAAAAPYLPPPETAADLAVNPTLLGAPEEVAAAGTPSGGPGDGSNAQAIANLQNQAIVGLGGGGAATPGDFYAALIGQVGSDVAGAQAAQSQQQSLQQSIENQQQQISGVSLNEEMVQMVQAQNTFASAARVVSAIDSMLGTLVQMVQ
jgi:flagellar hook-associated protein 1 FlgK